MFNLLLAFKAVHGNVFGCFIFIILLTESLSVKFCILILLFY
ncbi:hypothetical protein RU90_GL000931 [Lactococcus lactis subsp. hordniae]|uniref:Uncharacterized protein n=1 Tax=Lactococcus lactis subsp. hordniae TaxID=203404 RepID=A0A2A5SKR4_LACLH|nr:hypothetical protein RU90_GL000931 [Lactococcus lactis subsp. hordniae]